MVITLEPITGDRDEHSNRSSVDELPQPQSATILKIEMSVQINRQRDRLVRRGSRGGLEIEMSIQIDRQLYYRKSDPRPILSGDRDERSNRSSDALATGARSPRNATGNQDERSNRSSDLAAGTAPWGSR